MKLNCLFIFAVWTIWTGLRTFQFLFSIPYFYFAIFNSACSLTHIDFPKTDERREHLWSTLLDNLSAFLKIYFRAWKLYSKLAAHLQKTFVVEHLFGTAFKTKNSKKLLKTFFLVKPSEVVPCRCFAKIHLSKKQHLLSDL